MLGNAVNLGNIRVGDEGGGPCWNVNQPAPKIKPRQRVAMSIKGGHKRED